MENPFKQPFSLNGHNNYIARCRAFYKMLTALSSIYNVYFMLGMYSRLVWECYSCGPLTQWTRGRTLVRLLAHFVFRCFEQWFFFLRVHNRVIDGGFFNWKKNDRSGSSIPLSRFRLFNDTLSSLAWLENSLQKTSNESIKLFPPLYRFKAAVDWIQIKNTNKFDVFIAMDHFTCMKLGSANKRTILPQSLSRIE